MSPTNTPTLVEFATPDALTLRGDAWGESDNQPVLLLHGGGQTRNAWGDTARVLAENGYYAVVIDLRGHGQSDWSKNGDYDVEQFLADVRAVINTFKQKPILVGASLGGIISLLLEGESPEPLAKAIVLVDVAPQIQESGVNRIRAFMESHLQGFANFEEATKAVSEYLPHRRRPDDFSGLEKNLRQSDDGRLIWHWDPAMLRNFKTKDVGNIERLTRAASALTTPLLFVRGALSDIVSPKIMHEFLALVPHAQAVEIAGAGHTVPGDSNELFTDAVLKFVESLNSAQT